MFDMKKAPYVKCMEPFVYVDMSWLLQKKGWHICLQPFFSVDMSWSLQAKKPG